LTGSADGTARLWDIATGVELRRFSGHTAAVWGAAFSPDGRRLATTSADDSVKLWLTDLDELASAVCDSLPRDLTAAERESYGVTDSAPTCPEFSSPSGIDEMR
jgi:WD40 repeat protein